MAALPDEIQTARLVLRPFAPEDAAAVFSYSTSHAEWGRFQGLPSPYSLRDAETFVDELIARSRETRPNWAITLAGRVVGIVSIGFEADHRIAVLGYGVHAAHWGAGFAGEGAGAIVDRCFRHYEALMRIRAHTDGRNGRSLRVLEKLGFTHEGTLRRNAFSNGEFIDDAVCGLLREEWSGS